MRTSKRPWLSIWLGLFLLISGCATQPGGLPPQGSSQPPQRGGATGPYALTINDAHCHFVNFLQESEGTAALLKAMDSAGVGHVVLMGLPVVKKWDASDSRKPTYYNDNDSKAYYYSAGDVVLARAVTQLPPEQRKRVHPLMCGFNPTDMNAIDHVRRMMEWYPDLWEGIGEILTRHDDLTRLTQEETARANHPALKAVYGFAAEHDLPVWVHSNLATLGLEDTLYLDEMHSAVKDNPRTRFVWCHAGHSRHLKIPSLVKVADQMLGEFKNLWIDLSWLVYDEAVAPGGVPDPRWIALIEKYPDRFLIGSDKIGAYTTYKAEIRKYEPLLKALTPAVAKAVAADNLWRVLPARVSKSVGTAPGK